MAHPHATQHEPEATRREHDGNGRAREDGHGGSRLDRLGEMFREPEQLRRTARSAIEDYPLLTLGAVVLAGYLVGRMLRR